MSRRVVACGVQGASTELSEVAAESTLLLASLRTAARTSFAAAAHASREVADDNDNIDKHHLQLQNLMYQKNHLLQEIQRCEDYE